MTQKFAALVGCIDFRFLHGPGGRDMIQEFAINTGFNCYPITRAGGILDLVRPAMLNFDECLIKDIRLPIEHRGARDIFLVNHGNCTAYPVYSELEEERRVHIEDLRNAHQILGNIFPNINIWMFYAEPRPKTTNKFILRKVA